MDYFDNLIYDIDIHVEELNTIIGCAIAGAFNYYAKHEIRVSGIYDFKYESNNRQLFANLNASVSIPGFQFSAKTSFDLTEEQIRECLNNYLSQLDNAQYEVVSILPFEGKKGLDMSYIRLKVKKRIKEKEEVVEEQKKLSLTDNTEKEG